MCLSAQQGVNRQTQTQKRSCNQTRPCWLCLGLPAGCCFDDVSSIISRFPGLLTIRVDPACAFITVKGDLVAFLQCRGRWFSRPSTPRVYKYRSYNSYVWNVYIIYIHTRNTYAIWFYCIYIYICEYIIYIIIIQCNLSYTYIARLTYSRVLICMTKLCTESRWRWLSCGDAATTGSRIHGMIWMCSLW